MKKEQKKGTIEINQTIISIKRNPKKWNRDITIKVKGKVITMRDFIKENSTGLSFYENLERLGSVESTIEYMSTNARQLYGDFSKAITLENIEQKRNELLNVWKRLPHDERAKFGNSFESFLANGETYFKGIKNLIIEGINNDQKTNNSAPTDTTKENSKE